MTDRFPRLLVATEFPPNAPGGGPAVVRQMLRDWPADRLFWWSCLPEQDQKFGRQVAAHHVATIPAKLYPHHRWVRPKTWLLENVWTDWAASRLAKTLESIRPEVVWTVPHGWSIPPLSRVLPKYGTGFHVSMHDYADCGSRVRSLGTATTQRLLAQADGLYASSSTCDAICQAMVDDLQRRTGRSGNVARAGLEPEDFDFLETSLPEKNGPLRIAYAGTILVEETFARFATGLGQIRNRLPRPVSLEFYGNHSYRTSSWFRADWMNEHGNLTAARLAAELRRCDWGFSPMSMMDDDPRYNRYSLPTKFVSYVSAGLPIISMGHPDSSVMTMAAAYDVGACIKAVDAADWPDQLLAALSEPDPSRKYREALRRCAAVEFDMRRMRSVLYDCFSQCAEITRRRKQP